MMSSVRAAAGVARVLSDPLRLQILLRLVQSDATVSDLVHELSESQPAVSNQLAKLRNASFVVARMVGRQRVYAIADPDLARVIEALGAISNPPAAAGRLTPDLKRARTCYDHLAGTLGVDLFDVLWSAGAIAEGTARARPSIVAGSNAAEVFDWLGVQLPAERGLRRAYAFGCLDWSERRPHLGGALGAAICTRFRETRWVTSGVGRSVILTDGGDRRMRQLMDGKWQRD